MSTGLFLTFLIPTQFKQLMIRLDPDEEADEDEEGRPKPQKQILVPTQQQPTEMSNDATVNNHLNNVQINLTRVSLPPEYQNYVSLLSSH
jgi:hypothetical protein